MKASLAERLEQLSMPVPESGCVLWLGRINRGGYGVLTVNGKKALVHRVAYELERGMIPQDLTIDHLCRVRSCINARHMEPVSSKTNTLRGVSPLADKARQTHCKYGHSLTGENLYVDPRGQRQCRQCNGRRTKQSRERKN